MDKPMSPQQWEALPEGLKAIIQPLSQAEYDRRMAEWKAGNAKHDALAAFVRSLQDVGGRYWINPGMPITMARVFFDNRRKGIKGHVMVGSRMASSRALHDYLVARGVDGLVWNEVGERPAFKPAARVTSYLERSAQE